MMRFNFVLLCMYFQHVLSDERVVEMARKAAEQNDDNDEKDAGGGTHEDTQPAIIPSRIIVGAGFHILFCLKFSPDKNLNTYHH